MLISAYIVMLIDVYSLTFGRQQQLLSTVMNPLVNSLQPRHWYKQLPWWRLHLSIPALEIRRTKTKFSPKQKKTTTTKFVALSGDSLLLISSEVLATVTQSSTKGNEPPVENHLTITLSKAYQRETYRHVADDVQIRPRHEFVAPTLLQS